MSTLFTMLTSLPAEAFKPYTHVATAQPALADVVDDGRVTIDGREYAVRPAVVQALRDWPTYYQAGVIGPDGFPDLTFGQSTIHPEQTGKWIGYLMTEAWAAQSDPTYSTAERGQILAFAYGFATHAAGDMWAHTFVNDFAQGIFPSVGDVVTDVDKAEIALRHIIVEGYIGDATPGYDGNPDRSTLANGDVSSDSTPAIGFDAPNRWIYNVLVDPNKALPVGRCGDGLDDDGDGVADDGCPGGGPHTAGDGPEPVRGPLIDYFLDLRSDLQIQKAVAQADREYDDCALIDPDCYERTATVTINTVRGQRSDTYQRNECIGATIGCLPDPFELGDDLIFQNIVIGYLDAWIDDIDDGLKAWGQVGLGSTRALFDAQALRDTQNDECDHLGGEGNITRANCEDAIGATDVLLHELDPFINDHMISMLGAPDVVGDARGILQSFSEILDDILGPALNPLRLVTDEIKELAKEIVIEEINQAFGVDIEVLGSFLKHPSYWLDVQQVSLDLGPLGTQQVDLFEPEDHARLDALMGMPAEHHTDRTIKLPGGGTATSSEVSVSAEFGDLAIFDNAVTTSKMVLLDAAGLNELAGDQLLAEGVVKTATSVATYADRAGRPANVMVDGLGDVNWLSTIDGDHVWRANGLPRFGPGENPDDPHGGAGTFPLWESCVLRPAFRTLYEDWETNPAWWPKLDQYEIDDPNFPALGDETSSDPSDTSAPTISTVLGGGSTYDGPGGESFVGPGTSITVSATDDVFADSYVEVQSRLYRQGTAPPPWTDAPNGVAVPLGSMPDGPYVLDTRAGDPCHPAAAAPGSSTEFVLDTTGPAIDITSPAPEGVTFDTSQAVEMQFTADDGTFGSGVKTTSMSLDGEPATAGQTIDMFLLSPGAHAVEVTATDNLDNASSQVRHFEVHATSRSLLANIERACTTGLISKKGSCNSLTAKLRAAIAAHDRDQHHTEGNMLGALTNEISAQRGKSVDPGTADQLAAHIEDLIQRGT